MPPAPPHWGIEEYQDPSSSQFASLFDNLAKLITPPSEETMNLLYKRLAITVDDNGKSVAKPGKDQFQVNLDIHHFAPNEIKVKISKGFLVVEGRHGIKKDDHGWVAREFTRRFELPESCNLSAVRSELTSDGVLTVTAPLEAPQPQEERIVPIVRTGPLKTFYGNHRRANNGANNPSDAEEGTNTPPDAEDGSNTPPVEDDGAKTPPLPDEEL